MQKKSIVRVCLLVGIMLASFIGCSDEQEVTDLEIWQIVVDINAVMGESQAEDPEGVERKFKEALARSSVLESAEQKEKFLNYSAAIGEADDAVYMIRSHSEWERGDMFIGEEQTLNQVGAFVFGDAADFDTQGLSDVQIEFGTEVEKNLRIVISGEQDSVFSADNLIGRNVTLRHMIENDVSIEEHYSLGNIDEEKQKKLDSIWEEEIEKYEQSLEQ